MSSKSLARTIHLKFFTFVVAMLLAALEATAETGSSDQPWETGGVVSGGAKSSKNGARCYDKSNQEVACSRKRWIMVGSVIGAIFTSLGVVFLCLRCLEMWKKRKNRAILEENERLSDPVWRASDCERGVPQVSKNGETDDYYLHPDVSDPYRASLSRTISTVSSDGRPPSYNQVHQPLEALDSGYTPLSRP